jgi:hypothetical protein
MFLKWNSFFSLSSIRNIYEFHPWFFLINSIPMFFNVWEYSNDEVNYADITGRLRSLKISFVIWNFLSSKKWMNENHSRLSYLWMSRFVIRREFEDIIPNATFNTRNPKLCSTIRTDKCYSSNNVRLFWRKDVFPSRLIYIPRLDYYFILSFKFFILINQILLYKRK